MTTAYIGVKVVAAWPERGKKGQEGYAVRYEDGYQSWCPKATFESSYRPVRGKEAEIILTYRPTDET